MPRVALAERHNENSSNPGIDTGFRLIFAVDGTIVDRGFGDYVETFIPGFWEDPRSFVPRFYIPNKKEDAWWRVARYRPNVDALRLIYALINGGRTQKPQTIVGVRRDIPAIGILFRKDDRVAYTNLDLDGKKDGPKPSEVIEFLLTLGIAFMPVPGSGAEGKFRVLMRHTRAYSITELHKRWKVIFAANGWQVEKGSIEIFPSTTNGRMPLGYRACRLYNPRDLTQSQELPFDELLSRFRQSEASDLDDLCARFGTNPLELDDGKKSSVDAAETKSKTQETNDKSGNAYETNPDPDLQKTSKSKGKKRELTPRERADVERYRTQGVEPGERDYAISLLVRDDICRGFTKSRTVDDLAQWVRDEKIARSNFAKENGSGYIAKQIEDLPRRVEGLFAKYKKQESPPRHLSVRDILNLAPHVERVAAQFGITVECAGKEVLRLLPRWKGYPDAIRTELGIETNFSIFKKAAGGREDYAEIRDAFGFWRATSEYITQRWSMNGQGRARRYACDFPFDASSPGRALGRTWKQALKVAKERQDKS